MIDVSTNGEKSGLLSRLEGRGSSFVYSVFDNQEQAVSLTMPPQPNSWDWDYGLLPIFEMNLPEGALRSKLHSQFAKALGHFDALDLLSITGRHQIGRLEYGSLAGVGSTLPDTSVGFQSVDEILKARRDGELFGFLMNRYAGQSGISGVQPKVLIQDLTKFSAVQKLSEDIGEGRASISLSSATHIVKLWEAREYPELAANEYFCLQAAKRAGLSVPLCHLSETGEALVVERFDLGVTADARTGQDRDLYRGFEDFCVLNGINSEDKYRGSYESKLFRRMLDYVDPKTAYEDLREAFKLFVLNVILRNGDAHLKNFGVLYDTLAGAVRLAPVYDIVTTTAYIPQDGMALTLGGSTRWPSRGKLERLGTSLCELGPKDISFIIEETSQAVSETQQAVKAYFNQCPTPEVGKAMLGAWKTGLASLNR